MHRLSKNVTLLPVIFALCMSAFSHAQNAQIILDRDGSTIVLEPYAPNIIRVTLSRLKDQAIAAPGFGFLGTPSMTGWTSEQDSGGYEVIRSGRMIVRVAPRSPSPPHGLPLDQLNESLREHYFGDSPRGMASPFNDTISIATASGKPLLAMRRWIMIPNRPQGSSGSAENGQKADPGYGISAIFDSPTGEHYYGMGQHQQGFLDLRDRRIDCWHDHDALAGETVCVPFMVSSRDYGLIWDNPSKTTIDLGFNLQNVWSSEVGDRISFFVIAGDNTDEIYEGYRQLTGIAHMLPKAAYGYIQSKAIYPTQDQLMAVAKGYRERNLPLDILVVDFLNMTKQGNLDLDPARWPDPAAMNKQLHAMGITTLFSVALRSRHALLQHAEAKGLANSHRGRQAGFRSVQGRDRSKHRHHKPFRCQVVVGGDPRSLHQT